MKTINEEKYVLPHSQDFNTCRTSNRIFSKIVVVRGHHGILLATVLGGDSHDNTVWVLGILAHTVCLHVCCLEIPDTHLWYIPGSALSTIWGLLVPIKKST